MRYFVDTNVLFYAYDRKDRTRHRVASDCLRQLWATGSGVTSVQVLKEFYVNATRPHGLMTPAEARSVIGTYLGWPVQPLEPTDVLQAAEIQERNRISFWDALVVLAAKQLGAEVLLTEDLNHGQRIEGLQVHNPFLDEPLPQ